MGIPEDIFLTPFSFHLLCAICLDVSEAPVLTSCGHVFCHACFRKLEKNAKVKCPNCRKELGINEVASALWLDYFIQHASVACNGMDVCVWTGSYAEFQKHVKVCCLRNCKGNLPWIRKIASCTMAEISALPTKELISMLTQLGVTTSLFVDKTDLIEALYSIFHIHSKLSSVDKLISDGFTKKEQITAELNKNSVKDLKFKLLQLLILSDKGKQDLVHIISILFDKAELVNLVYENLEIQSMLNVIPTGEIPNVSQKRKVSSEFDQQSPYHTWFNSRELLSENILGLDTAFSSNIRLNLEANFNASRTDRNNSDQSDSNQCDDVDSCLKCIIS